MIHLVHAVPVIDGAVGREGVRELITFIANGIVKHQAVLLGRVEAPKKKKVRWLLGFLHLSQYCEY